MSSVVAVCISLAFSGHACGKANLAVYTPPPAARGGAALVLPETPVETGQRLARARGWVGEQWGCLYALWNRESGWQVRDPNPRSQADGIPQANPASKMGPGWETDAAQQIRWGLGYIAGRYGTPCAAWAHSNAYNYY